ncbi:Photosystem I assembly protein Ycf3 [uncultured archaeon]|nr:Photosystem I assembly protein Ycf3 [uncultured archaeon]
MEFRPKKCEVCGISLSEGDKFCPMCNKPVESSKSRFMSLKSISRKRPGMILISGIVIGTMILASAIYTTQYLDDWNAKGKNALTSENYNEAIEDFNKALKLNPSSEDALNGLGDAYYNLIKSEGNQYNLPLSYYDKANKCNKTGNSTYALKKMGMIDLSKENYNNSKEKFQRIINQNKISRSDLADAWYNKGKAFWKLNDPQEAIKCFNEAITILKGEVNSQTQYQAFLSLYLGSIGEVLFKEGKTDKASQYYENALDTDTNCQDCSHFCENLIKIYENSNRTEEAEKYKKKCPENFWNK